MGDAGATMRSDGTLDSGFSSDNVEVNAAASQDGNVKFTVAPKTARGDARPPRFFIPILAGLSLCTTRFAAQKVPDCGAYPLRTRQGSQGDCLPPRSFCVILNRAYSSLRVKMKQ